MWQFNKLLRRIEATANVVRESDGSESNMAEFAQEIFAKIWQRINNPFSLVGIVKQQSWHTKANSATCQCGLQRSLLMVRLCIIIQFIQYQHKTP